MPITLLKLIPITYSKLISVAHSKLSSITHSKLIPITHSTLIPIKQMKFEMNCNTFQTNSCLLNTCDKFYAHSTNSIPQFVLKSLKYI